MKTLTRLLTLTALATCFALAAFAQDPAAAPADPCASADKDALYTKYYEEKKKEADQQPAFETAKQYLAKYSSCPDRYTASVKKFHDTYASLLGAANEEKDFLVALYGNGDANKTGRNIPKAFEIGKRLLAKDADNLPVLVQLGYAGYFEWANKNPAFVADSSANLRKAVQLIEGGKSIDKWTPFASREETLSFLNFYLGELTITGTKDAAQTAALKSALPIYMKAATLEGPAKKLAETYARIALAYHVTQYTPMLAEYTKMYPTESEESKAALEQLNQVMDRVIDGYARAINLAGSEPKYAKDKATWTQELTALYNFRHKGKESGLNAFIAGITATPLPEPFTPKPFVATPVSGANGTQPTATAEKKP